MAGAPSRRGVTRPILGLTFGGFGSGETPFVDVRFYADDKRLESLLADAFGDIKINPKCG